jgi:cyclophilin family peptidyl-prolyl cis-trans isomerase
VSIRLFLLLALAIALPASATPPPAADPVPPPVTAPEPLPPPPPAPPVRVLIVTTLGEIEVELDPHSAPKTVENFLAYARDGHYNGTVFHRVIPGLLLQAGAFTPDLQQKPSRAPVANEADNGRSNLRGTLAAARDRGVVDSATAQFFINLADNLAFDRQGDDSPYTAGYAVFGRVVHGMDVVDRIAAQPTSAQGPFPGWVPRVPVVIERVVFKDGGATGAPADADPGTGAGRDAGADAEGGVEADDDVDAESDGDTAPEDDAGALPR